MSTDQGRMTPRDAARINIEADHERRYWTTRLGCSEAQLVEAVTAVGALVKDVEPYLAELDYS